MEQAAGSGAAGAVCVGEQRDDNQAVAEPADGGQRGDPAAVAVTRIGVVTPPGQVTVSAPRSIPKHGATADNTHRPVAIEALLQEAVDKVGGGKPGKAAKYTFGLAQGAKL